MAELRAGLKANLDATITGAQVSAYGLSQPTPPGIQIRPGRTDWHKAMGGVQNVRSFVVQAFVAYSSDIGAQVLLDEWLDPTGPQSIAAALTSDRTLGGKAAGLVLGDQEAPGIVDRASGGQLLVAEFPVEVHVTN